MNEEELAVKLTEFAYALENTENHVMETSLRLCRIVDRIVGMQPAQPGNKNPEGPSESLLSRLDRACNNIERYLVSMNDDLSRL